MPSDLPSSPDVTAPDQVLLYALDGGQVLATGADAAEMSDDGAYAGRTLDMPVPCFLVRHPLGDLMWDTGMSADSNRSW